MVRHSLFRTVSWLAIAVFFLVLPQSCVNEEYDISKIDKTVAFGGDQLVFPLGSTGQLTLSKLLSEEDMDYLVTLTDGAYGFMTDGTMNVDEDDLHDFSQQIQIDPIRISEQSDPISVGEIDVEGLKNLRIDPVESEIGIEDIDVPEITLPEDPVRPDVSSGISDYIPDLSVEEELGSRDIRTDIPVSLDQWYDLPANDVLYSIDGTQFGSITVGDASAPVDIRFDNLPEGVSDIRDVKFTGNSRMTITAEIINPFFSEGMMDLSRLRLIVGDVFTTVENGETITFSENLGSHNSFREEFSMTLDELTAIDASGTFRLEGSVAFGSNMVTSSKLIRESVDAGGPQLHISVAFNDIGIKDFMMDIDMERNIADETDPVTFEMGIASVTLPEQVSSIREVRFTEGSKIGIGIEGAGPNPEGFHPELVLDFRFPESIVSPDLRNHVYSYSVDLGSHVADTEIAVSALTGLENTTADGQIDIDDVVSVTGTLKGRGSVSYSTLKNLETLSFIVTPDAEVEDCDLTISVEPVEIPEDTKTADIDLPDGVEDIGDLILTPEGNPYLNVAIGIPSNGSVAFEARDMKVSFPDYVVFDEERIEGKYDFNSADNSITVNGRIDSDIRLGIDHLMVSPVLDNDGTGYIASGEISYSGSIAVVPLREDGIVSSRDLEFLLDDLRVGENVVIPLTATVEDLAISEVGIESFEKNIDQTFEIGLFNFDDLPEEILHIKSADLINTSLNLSVEVENLPDLGADPYIDVNVSMPSEIIFARDSRVDDDNNIHIKGTLVDGVYAIEPLVITGLDLDGVDLAAGEGEFTKPVKVTGSIAASNVGISLDELGNSEDFFVKVTGTIPVEISKVTGYVDYKLENEEDEDGFGATIKLDDLPDFMKGEDFNLDFTNPYITVDVTSNLGIPFKGDLVITPYVADIPQTDRIIKVPDIEIPEAVSSSEPKTTHYFIAETERSKPGAGYVFLQVDRLTDLLRQIPDAIRIDINAGTDPERESGIEVSPENPYSVEFGYNVVVPFEFGPDLNIVMDYTFPGKADDQDGQNGGESTGGDRLPPELGELLNMNSLGLAGTIESTLPLNLELTIDLLDSDKEIIPAEPSTAVIYGGTRNNPEISELDFRLKLQNGADASDLSYIRMNFTVTSAIAPDGEPLAVTEDSYLKATLKAKVPGGVTIDLSNLGESENSEN